MISLFKKLNLKNQQLIFIINSPDSFKAEAELIKKEVTVKETIVYVILPDINMQNYQVSLLKLLTAYYLITAAILHCGPIYCFRLNNHK